MNAVFDFVKAAAPWVMMGIALAVFFCRSAAKKRKNQEKEPGGDYSMEGMSLGMCFGVAIGTALKGNIAMGLSLGMLVGLALGSCIRKEAQDD